MNKLRIIFFTIIYLFANTSFGLGERNNVRLDSLIDMLSSKNRFMGCLTIRKNGNIIYNKACGISNWNGNEKIPATAATKYRIGSISKMFTSVMIFQLIEEGRLSMETKLADFFPEIPYAGDITVGNLLNHRSGIYSFTGSRDYLKWYTIPKSQSEMLKIISSGKPVFKPNKKAEYSNSNYVLLGYIIEKITLQSYSENLRNRITEKIGINSTYYGGTVTAAKNESNSFSYNDNDWLTEPETDMSIPGGAGAMVSTTNDLTTFISALFEEKLISNSSLSEMKKIDNGYGKGIFSKTFFDKTAYGHGGAIDQFRSGLYFVTADSISIAVCCNVDYGVEKVLYAVLAIYYNKPYQIPAFNYVLVNKDTLRQYEGVYKHMILPIKAIIKLNGDNLTLCFLEKKEEVIASMPVYIFDAVSPGKFENYSNGGSFVIDNNKLSFYQEKMIPHKLRFRRKKK